MTSPPARRRDRPHDGAKADVYAVGVALYVMVAGAVPQTKNGAHPPVGTPGPGSLTGV
jgi:hypothetical protein